MPSVDVVPSLTSPDRILGLQLTLASASPRLRVHTLRLEDAAAFIPAASSTDEAAAGYLLPDATHMRCRSTRSATRGRFDQLKRHVPLEVEVVVVGFLKSHAKGETK